MDIPTLLMDRFSIIDRAYYETEQTQSYLRVEVKALALAGLTSLTNDIVALLDTELGVERNFILDVYTAPEGLEITWHDLNKHVNNYLDISLKTPVKNQQTYFGVLLSYNEQELILRWNAKGQMRKIQLTKENIATLKVGIKW